MFIEYTYLIMYCTKGTLTFHPRLFHIAYQCAKIVQHQKLVELFANLAMAYLRSLPFRLLYCLQIPKVPQYPHIHTVPLMIQ